MLGMALWLAWEDYDMRYVNTHKRSTSKFGYNYKRNGNWWWLIGIWLPFVNIIPIFIFAMATFVTLNKKWETYIDKHFINRKE
jgi:hypothetical protein